MSIVLIKLAGTGFTTYGGLKTAIADILEDDGTALNAFIPNAISLAESRIADKVRCRATEELRSKALTQSSEFVDLDEDTIEVTDVLLDTNPKRALEYVPTFQSPRLIPYQDEATPYYYSIQGQRLQIRPIANQDYTLQITLYFRLAAFFNEDDTNWLLTNHPAVYLYAALAECYYFKMDEDTGDRYLAYWEKVVKELNRSEKKLKYPGPLKRRTMGPTP